MISVIVPVYNVEEYLNRCIESIINQTYRDFEVILVDDGSTDNSGVICDEYSNTIEYINTIHKKNGGLSSARNVGIDYARGETITFIDSDDYISPYYLEILKKLISHEGVEVGVIGFAVGESTEYCFSEFHDSDEIIYESMDYIFDMITNSYLQSACGKIYSRELFENCRFIENRVLEDTGLTYKIFYYASKICVSKEPLYYYYQRSGSIMHRKFSEQDYSGILSYEERVLFFKNIGENRLYERFMQQYVGMALKYYYLSYRYLYFDKEERRRLLFSLRRGYDDCHNSIEWSPIAMLVGFVGKKFPLIVGWLISFFI